MPHQTPHVVSPMPHQTPHAVPPVPNQSLQASWQGPLCDPWWTRPMRVPRAQSRSASRGHSRQRHFAARSRLTLSEKSPRVYVSCVHFTLSTTRGQRSCSSPVASVPGVGCRLHAAPLSVRESLGSAVAGIRISCSDERRVASLTRGSLTPGSLCAALSCGECRRCSSRGGARRTCGCQSTSQRRWCPLWRMPKRYAWGRTHAWVLVPPSAPAVKEMGVCSSTGTSVTGTSCYCANASSTSGRSYWQSFGSTPWGLRGTFPWRLNIAWTWEEPFAADPCEASMGMGVRCVPLPFSLLSGCCLSGTNPEPSTLHPAAACAGGGGDGGLCLCW